MNFLRPCFEAYVINQPDLGNVINQLVALFISSSSSALNKQVLNFCSVYVPYLGGRTAYANFLDSLFEVMTKRLIENDITDKLLEKRILVICTYIFGFNVLRKNFSLIRCVEKQNISSTILQFLDATGLCTSSMLDMLVTRMTTSKTEMDSVDILSEFYIEMKNSGDGSSDH